MAQGFELRGKVVDEKGQGLYGATIHLHETFQGVSSSDSGYFTLKDIRPGHYHLHVSYLGYKAWDGELNLPTDSGRFWVIQLQPSSLELNEAVVEGNVLKLERNKWSIPVHVLGEEALNRSQTFTLGQSLEQIPGVSSINMGVSVSKPVIRGLSGTRILVAENGIKQEGQQWGGDHGLEIDALNVEQVEVIKGPASLLYGSDAIGGVVHIRQPLVPMPGTHEAKLSLLGKSLNDAIGGSALVGGNHKGLSYRFRATWQEQGDYRVPADSFTYNTYTLPINGGRLKNTAGKEAHISAQIGLNRRWGYTRLAYSRFEQKAGIFSGAVGIPRAYLLVDDEKDRNLDLPYQHTTHHKLISNTNVQLGRHWLEADIAYQYNQRRELSAPHAHGQLPDTTWGNLAHGLFLQTLSSNIRFHQQLTKKVKLVYGNQSQYQNHRFEGFEFLLPAFRQWQTGFYTVMSWKPSSKTSFNGGLRADYAAMQSDEHRQIRWKNYVPHGEQVRAQAISRAFVNWSGSVGMTHQFNSKLHLKTNVGKSFRTPSVQELTVNGVHHGAFRHELGDPNLKSEIAYQLDIGLFYETRHFQASVNPYLNYFSNYIFLRPSAQFSPLPEAGQLYRFEQASAFLRGAEFQVEWHPWEQLHLEADYALSLGTNLDLNLPLPFMPPGRFKSMVEWEQDLRRGPLQSWYTRFQFQAVQAQNRTDRNEFKTPAYQLVDFGLGFQLKRKNKAWLDIALSVQNLFNTRYFQHLSRWRYLGIPEPGRNISLRVNIPLW